MHFVLLPFHCGSQEINFYLLCQKVWRVSLGAQEAVLLGGVVVHLQAVWAVVAKAGLLRLHTIGCLVPGPTI